MGASSRYQFIDGMRGLAAMAVMVFHIGRDFLGLEVLRFGKYGVMVFFVISGFVICHALNSKVVTGRFVGIFMLRRSVRLDPTYWVCILLALVVLWLPAQILNYPLVMPSLTTIGLHAFYLQDLTQSPTINIVFWTLCYEIQFYLVLCLLYYIAESAHRFFSHIDRLTWRLWILIPALVLSLLWPLQITHWLYIKNTIPGLFIDLWYLFLLGVFAYLAINNNVARWVLIAAVLALLFSASLIAFIGVTTALLFLYAGLGNGLNNWLSWRWVQFLGLISYSLYLSHDVVGAYLRDTGLHLANKYLGFNQPLFVSMWVLFCMFFSLWFAYLLYRLIERPTHRWSRLIG